MGLIRRIKDQYLRLVGIGEGMQPFLLLAIRLLWGIPFMVSGYDKLMHIQTTISFFSQLHIPFPEFSAYAVGYIEAIGGACITLGCAARLASIPLIITMIVAYLTAHFEVFKEIWNHPMAFTNEAPFNFLLACLLILAFGPGEISVDHFVKEKGGR